MEKVEVKVKKEKKSKKDKLTDIFWDFIVKPLIDKAVEVTQMPTRELVIKLVETGTTLGYLARIYDLKKYLKKFDILLKMVKEMAKNATPEDVDKFINYVVNEVLPKKDPVLADLFKDEKVYTWFRQSVFELWQLFKGE